MSHRYYLTQRPPKPGAIPKPKENKILEVTTATMLTTEASNKDAAAGKACGMTWEHDADDIPGKTMRSGTLHESSGVKSTWYPITVSSRKHGGGLKIFSGQIVRSVNRPDDKKKDTKKMQLKTRYFSSWQEAQRVMHVIEGLNITVERVRMSATQGEAKVFINDVFILSFGDKIVLPKKDANPSDYSGDNIGGWVSSEPDSAFFLGLIWHPLDHAYQYSKKVCEKLGIKPCEWIEESELM